MGRKANTVVLKSDFGLTQHEEANISVADCLPGFLVETGADGTFKPHSVANGASMKKFAKENYLLGCMLTGLDQNGKNWHVVGERLMVHKALPADVINVYLGPGEKPSKGDWAVSLGNGKIGKGAASQPANSTTASTAITATATETVFSNGTATLAANSMKAGDQYRIRASGIATATNAADTLTIKAYIGATLLADSGAIDVANNDTFDVNLTLSVVDIGAAGHFTCLGTIKLGGAAAVAKNINVASTVIDTTASQAITVKATWSSTNAGNSCVQNTFIVDRTTPTAPGTAPAALPTGVIPVGKFAETVTEADETHAAVDIAY